MSVLKYLIYCFLLAFILSGDAGAATVDPAASTTESMKNILTAEENPNDDFHQILKGMWGGFIFGDTSEEPTILSKVVGYVNVLALIMGIIITSYVTVGAVVNSASSGEVLGKQWSTYWLPIRSFVAFGLLIPTQMGVYALSTAQVMVIKLLIMASTSATLLWNVTAAESLEMSNSEPTLIRPYKLAYDTSLGMTCSIAVGKAAWFFDSRVVKFNYTDGSSIEVTYEDIDNSFSPLTNKLNQARYKLSSSSNKNYLHSLSFGEECGEFTFNIPDFNADSLSTFSNAMIDASDSSKLQKDLSRSINAAQQAADDLLEYQSAYLKFINDFSVNVIKSVEEPDDLVARLTLNQSNNPNNYNFFNVSSEYSNYGESGKDFSISDTVTTGYNNTGAGTPLKVKAKVIKYREVVDDFIEKVENIYITTGSVHTPVDQAAMHALITNGGWIYAGSFFYKIAQLEGISSQASSVMAKGEGSINLSSCGECEDDEEIMAAVELLSALYNYSYLKEIPEFSSLETSSEAKAVGLISSKTINSSINDTIASDAMSALAVKTLASAGTITGQSNLAGSDFGEMTANNPFQMAANIGHGMNNVRYFLWIMKSSATTSLFVTNSVENAVNASIAGTVGGGLIVGTISGIIKASLTLLIEFLTIAISLLTAMAWTLAYYIPMMPALLWITLAGAYILISIEGVVAIALAVILMATPEGEGISGSRFQSAIILLASIYLRPSLMIIGLVAAIFVAKYSFHILNIVFWSQAESAVRGDIFGFFATFTLYIVSLHQVLSNSIKSMDSLPTAILNWIGQGANAQFGQNEISGASSQMDSKEQAFGSAGDSFKSVFKEKRAIANSNSLAGKGTPAAGPKNA